MRVLWLTHTPAGASAELRFDDPGRGWIGSLETHIRNIEGLVLGVCFFSDSGDTKRFVRDNVTYYPMAFKHRSLWGKLYERLFDVLCDSNPDAIARAIADFKPDVIHLFGTESGVAEVVTLTDVPVVVHIQGLVNPYLYAWLPKGVSQGRIFWASSMRAKLFRRGIYYEYKRFKKRAQRELKVIHHARLFFGRTEWDRNFVKLVKAGFRYVHCEEVLRPIFYDSQWTAKQSTRFTIVTIINPQIYKGIEVVMEAAKLLVQFTPMKFEWNIIGIDGGHELVYLIEKLTGQKFSDYHVTFRGAKAVNEVINMLMSADVFVHPSHIDNSPNSVCEAMILGIPVICGYVGGVPSLVEDKISGTLYNSEDPYDLAGKLAVAACDRSTLAKMAEKGRERALQRHDITKIVGTVYSTYKSVIEENG